MGAHVVCVSVAVRLRQRRRVIITNQWQGVINANPPNDGRRSPPANGGEPASVVRGAYTSLKRWQTREIQTRYAARANKESGWARYNVRQVASPSQQQSRQKRIR